MPHYAYFKVHIADGFKEDCEEIIQKCLELDTLNFYTFTDLWKEMNFACIYQGRPTGAEIAELSEEVVHVAKQFMLANTSNFKESQVGLYLVYALLTQQPYPNFAWLRVTPDDVCAIKCIETVARNNKQYDVLYILGTILIKYTQYHAIERERGFDETLKKYMDGCTSLDKDGLRPKGVFYQQSDELDMIKDIGVIARRYAQVRKSVTDTYKDSPNVNYINENLASELQKTLQNVMNGHLDAETDAEHYESVQSIKHKAMANTVNPMAHLTSATQRKLNISPQKKSDIKTKPEKVRSCSPIKAMSSSPLKRKPLPAFTKPKRAKTFFMNSLQESDVELNLEAFHQETNKSNHNSDDNLSDSDEVNSKMEESNKDDIENISKTSFPAVIHSKAGENYCEIEILDYASQDKVPVHTIISDVLKRPDTEGPGTSAEPELSSSSEKETKQKLKNKKPPKKKVTQRNLILDKIGVLPVANFSQDK